MAMGKYVGNEGLHKHSPSFNERAGVWMFKSGCPASSPTGCAIPYAERPMICKMFPYLPIPVYQDDIKDVHYKLLLDVERCPQWKAFGDNYDAAIKEFENG